MLQDMSFEQYFPQSSTYTADVGDVKLVGVKPSSICLICRGGKMLCGKVSCPLVSKAVSLSKYHSMIDSNLVDGSTPPGVFVGHVGYPCVYIGPMIPPFHGDTGILDSPEQWMGKSIDEIIDLRYALIRGKTRTRATAVHDSRLIQTLQELSMAEKPVDSEALFKKKPDKTLYLSEFSQPFGPSALLEDFTTSSIDVDSRIEKAYYDRDLKASHAIINLYDRGLEVTRIQRCLSAGMFGVEEARKLVPTRWSITAVDDMISKRLVERVKEYPTVDEYRVHRFSYLDNLYVVILIPLGWEFEWIEAWFPGTTWNINGASAELIGDYEGYRGRTTYAEVGGCYYSTRLAAAESLAKERKQACVLALREIHPGYTLPVGVWNVRESIRKTMKMKPQTFDTFKDALTHALSDYVIPRETWVSRSVILRKMLHQRRLDHFLR